MLMKSNRKVSYRSQCKWIQWHTHPHTHTLITQHVPAPFHSPPFTASVQPLPPSLALSPLELSPLFLPSLPLSTSTPLSSCENSLNVCVWTPRVCVLRRVLCVCIGVVCFSKWSRSAAVHQWSWLQTGEYSDLTAPLFNSHTGCFLDSF